MEMKLNTPSLGQKNNSSVLENEYFLEIIQEEL